jgi:hypothetical protein
MRLVPQLIAIPLLTVALHAQTIAPRAIAGGSFEASAVAHVPGTSGVLFTDDGRTREIFWMELDERGNQRGPVVAVPLGASVTDMEGMTFDGDFHYVVGSQSKTTGVTGDGLVRFRFDPTSRRVTEVERVAGLKGWLADHVLELRGTGTRLGDKVLNIEAIAWDPHRERLLLGLRAPVVNGDALVIPLRMRDSSAPLSADNLLVDGESIHLPLAGDGIRSLEYDGGVFRLIAGASLNSENRDFRILEWNGDHSVPVLRELDRLPRRLKPEGIASRQAETSAGVLVFDTSRFALLPW